MERKPITAWMTVNSACNLRCGWCYRTSSDFKTESNMNLELAKNITQVLKDLGVRSIVIIGGEPTLWPGLFDYNDFCSHLSIKTSLVTNAYKFNSDVFWSEYLKHRNTTIDLSLKAYDEESSILITKNKDFEGIKSGMKRVTDEYKNKISVVYSTFVEDHLVDMVSAAVDLGALSVRVGVCTPMSIKGEFVGPYTVDYKKMVSEISGNYKKLLDITKNKLTFTLSTPLCIWPKDFVKDIIAQNRIGNGCQFQHESGISFDTDGKVILCNSMFDCPVGKYGEDFTDSQSLIRLINSEKVNSIYRQINSYPSKLCIDCDLFQRCHGGCPIMWTTHNAEEVISSAERR